VLQNLSAKKKRSSAFNTTCLIPEGRRKKKKEKVTPRPEKRRRLYTSGWPNMGRRAEEREGGEEKGPRRPG